MKIYLNTRSFDNDYQWFKMAEDNTISISKNWWHIKEISKLPLNDEFSVTIGKLENDELFLLATDVQSNRLDNKNREINNSFLFISSDEIILRKLATLFLFNNEELVDKLNFIISDSQDEKLGFVAEYVQIMFAIETMLDIYDVKFEFDVNVNEQQRCRFGEIFTQYEVKDENNEILTEYQFNPVFEFKLKRFLLSEIFPENVEIIFSYFSYLTLQDIEEAQISLAVGKILDKFAHNLFIKNPEEWAKIDMKENSFKRIQSVFSKFQSEIISIILVLAIFIPLVLSYINLSTKNIEFETEKNLLISEKESLKVQNTNLAKQIQEFNVSISKYNNSIQNLEDELFTSQQENQNLSAKLDKLSELQTPQISNSSKKALVKCQSEKQREITQRKKLAIGYKWYKNKYQKCRKGQ